MTKALVVLAVGGALVGDQSPQRGAMPAAAGRRHRRRLCGDLPPSRRGWSDRALRIAVLERGQGGRGERSTQIEAWVGFREGRIRHNRGDRRRPLFRRREPPRSVRRGAS
jgi:hypothetical protein